MEAAAVFSSFSSGCISLTDKHMHSTSILLLGVFLYQECEEPIPMFAMGHVSKVRVARMLGKAVMCGKDLCFYHMDLCLNLSSIISSSWTTIGTYVCFPLFKV